MNNNKHHKSILIIFFFFVNYNRYLNTTITVIYVKCNYVFVLTKLILRPLMPMMSVCGCIKSVLSTTTTKRQSIGKAIKCKIQSSRPECHYSKRTRILQTIVLNTLYSTAVYVESVCFNKLTIFSYR